MSNLCSSQKRNASALGSHGIHTYQSSIAIMKVNAIKLYKVKPLVFVFSLVSMHYFKKESQLQTPLSCVCRTERSHPAKQRTSSEITGQLIPYLSLKQSMSYFYLDCSTIDKFLSSANFKEIFHILHLRIVYIKVGEKKVEYKTATAEDACYVLHTATLDWNSTLYQCVLI